MNTSICSTTVGVHPCELEGKDPSVAELLALAEDDNIIAIGETGLDYFHVEKDTADWQRERFRRHIAASNQSGKPMIIHTLCEYNIDFFKFRISNVNRG
jgi:TatD DNase family protein